jgi:cytochrome c oxidase assembly factor CtaG
VRTIIFLLVLITPRLVAAHTVAAGDPPGWNFAPWAMLSLGISLLLYIIGALRFGRRVNGGRTVFHRRALLFFAGWLITAGAVLSPLHEAGGRSFTLHMLEHEILMLIAAPLLVLARPTGVFVWAFSAAVRDGVRPFADILGWRRVWRVMTAPVFSTLVQAGALWFWHAPQLFDRALAQEGWHTAQHLSFFVTALLFWQAMLRNQRSPAQLGLAAVCLFITSLVTGALGTLMAFSDSPWYSGYAALGMTPFGLTPAEDQQLAGLIMWIPGGIVHAGAAFALIWKALRQAGVSEARIRWLT